MGVKKHREKLNAARPKMVERKGAGALERKRLEARMEGYESEDGETSDDQSDYEQQRRLARIEARDSEDELSEIEGHEDSDEDDEGLSSGEDDEESESEMEDHAGRKLVRGAPARRALPSAGDDDDGSGEEDESELDRESDDSEAGASDVSDGEESEDEEIQAMRKLQLELADMPFEQVHAMRNSMGAKKFDALQRDLANIDKRKEEKTMASKSDKPKKTKRENKNRPREMSSKKPVPRYREVVTVTKSRARDPRFDSLSGNFNKDLFEKSYSFLNDYRKAEVEQLHKELKKEKSEDRKKEIQSVISKMKQQERQRHIDEQKAALKRKQRQVEKQAVAEGKKPYYPKKSEFKLMERVSKYKDIAAQGEGKFKDYISKRRKKNAAKDHRFVPYERR